LPVPPRFPLLSALFGARPPRELSTQEACSRADEARRKWVEADFARLCFIYAGLAPNADPKLHAISSSGTCRLWNFEYFSREAERFLHVHVTADRVRTEETRVRAGGLNFPQWQYPFAAGGYCEDRDRKREPHPIPHPWADLAQCLDSLREAWGAARVEDLAESRSLARVASARRLARSCPKGRMTGRRAPGDPRNQSALILRPNNDPDRLLRRPLRPCFRKPLRMKRPAPIQPFLSAGSDCLVAQFSPQDLARRRSSGSVSMNSDFFRDT
jgi:hypothetical protein